MYECVIDNEVNKKTAIVKIQQLKHLGRQTNFLPASARNINSETREGDRAMWPEKRPPSLSVIRRAISSRKDYWLGRAACCTNAWAEIWIVIWINDARYRDVVSRAGEYFTNTIGSFWRHRIVGSSSKSSKTIANLIGMRVVSLWQFVSSLINWQWHQQPKNDTFQLSYSAYRMMRIHTF